MIRNKKVFNNLHKMIPQWTWQEIKYGLEKRIISFDEVREYAIDILSVDLKNFDKILGISVAEDDEINRIINELVSDESAQSADAVVSKWAFAIIYDSYLNERDSLYSVIDDVYSELDYPIEISPLISYMPSDDNSKSIDEKILSYISAGESRWMRSDDL